MEAVGASFVYVGIYWNIHHHMLHAGHKVTGPMLWANLRLFFWLSLFPFATGRMGANHFYLIAIPVAFWSPWIAQGLYVLVALVWLVPDRRIERPLSNIKPSLTRAGVACLTCPRKLV